MIGYHYTSLGNWKKIEKQGLIPYRLNKSEITEKLGGDFKAIWVWTKRLTGLAHSGSILYQAANRPTTKVVLLAVEYSKEDCRTEDYNKIITNHGGHIEKLIYHKNEPAVLIPKKIKPENIALVKIYDLEELLK